MEWWIPVNRFLNRKRRSYAWIAGGTLWIVWIISILLGPGKMDLANQVIGTDYIQFYAAGTTIRNGEGDRLYDFTYQRQLEQAIAGPEFDTFHAFITPPFLAVLYSPLSLIPYSLSFAVWSVLGVMFLYFSIRLLNSIEVKNQFLWALSWFPVFATISFGQNSLLSLMLLALTYVLWKHEKKLASGLICSLLIYKPQLIIGVGILWLLEWRHDYKSLVGLVLGGFILIGLSFWFLPIASKEYIHLTFERLPTLSSLKGFPLWHSQTLRDFWLLILPNTQQLANWFHIIVSAGGFLYFRRFRQHHFDQKSILFAGAICLTILITPHAMIYDWTILIIPALLVWEIRPQIHEQLTVLFALVWVVTFISTQLTHFQLNLFSRALQLSIPVFIFVLVSLYIVLQRSSKAYGQADSRL